MKHWSTHDKIGNRLSKSEPEGKTIYGYDNIYRLLSAVPEKLPHWRAGKEKETYSYDPVGNRLNGPDDRISYLYNQANQLTEQTGQWAMPFPNIRHHGHGRTEKSEYSYDKNGNLIKIVDPEGSHHRTVTLYSYDYENRLVKVEIQRGNQTNVVSFTYDPFGRRLSKTVQKEDLEDDDRENGKCRHNRHAPRSTYYIYDNQSIIMEYDKRGNTTARYIHGPNVDEPLALYRDRETYYYHADGLGSITALSDKHGNAVKKYDYDSFGNMDEDGENIDQPYTYTAREWDKEMGLYYYRARYYDPMEGRFISKDPIGFEGGMNLYGYTSNNPINFADPSGLTWTSNWEFFWDWVFEDGKAKRTYGQGSIEVQEMQTSPGAAKMRAAFKAGKCKNIYNGSFGSIEAYVKTALMPNSTAFQVGGFLYDAVNNDDGTVTYTIRNQASAYSFFYHIPGIPHKPRGGTLHLFGNIDQVFTWTEKSPCCN